MTIKVYAISQYLYCPYKLCLSQRYEGSKKGIYEIKKVSSAYRLMKYLHQDFEDMLRSNMWRVEVNMEVAEIKNILFKGVYSLIENALAIIDLDYYIQSPLRLKEEWINALQLEIEILALRIFKIMNNTNQAGREIMEMILPPALYSYLIYDKCLDLSGIVDKIEIIDGKYYPVKIKYGSPPLRGVWESDALEMVAYSLLTEKEFEIDVNVSFVEYVQLGDKRPVIIDSEIRASFFKLMDQVRKIIYDHEYPEIVQNLNKCKVCEYRTLCEHRG